MKMNNISNIKKYDRQSYRLPGYDYSAPGYYFATICTKNRECIFGEIQGDQMIKSPIGQIAEKYWLEIPNHFPNAILDEFIIMPNHIHAIIEIPYILAPINNNSDHGRVRHGEPLHDRNYEERMQKITAHRYQKIIPGSIGIIINQYKGAVTKMSKHEKNNPELPPIWQRNFYERIVHTDEGLEIVRRYIRENPRNWNSDHNNLTRID